ncbi:Hsp70 family protein [Actinokineospora pegani]|uniref:Hsp70 family protein n=1 Tax=Actinokineospora pegani TaxID=2654637 RepID=UPI0012EAE6A3|nr:Hsp70 family protein [Actinokineospora pegani]
MPYVLGIDVGRSRGVAAVCRRTPHGHTPPEVVPVDGGAPWFPAVLFVGGDGDVVLGRAALRRAAAEPDRLARNPLDRVGDDAAVLLGGELYPAETLVAAIAAWVVDSVAAVEGADPDRVAVTHPPDWGPHRRRLLREAVVEAGLPNPLLIPTVTAAAEARHDHTPVPTGAALVVALAGGSALETAVLHRTPGAFELTAHATHPHPGDALDDLLGDLPPETRTATKERLSTSAEVHLPHPDGDVRVTRQAFEELARPALAAIAATIRATLTTVPPDALAGALLAGGTANVPLLRTLTACPTEDNPAATPALGAALAARPLPHAPTRPRRPFPGSDPRLHPATPAHPDGPGSDPRLKPLPATNTPGPPIPGSHLLPSSLGTDPPPGATPHTPAQRPDGLVVPHRALPDHLAADPLLLTPHVPAPPPRVQPPPPPVPDPPVLPTTLDEPPPPRPPVEISPLVPPVSRFARKRDAPPEQAARKPAARPNTARKPRTKSEDPAEEPR